MVIDIKRYFQGKQGYLIEEASPNVISIRFDDSRVININPANTVQCEHCGFIALKYDRATRIAANGSTVQETFRCINPLCAKKSFRKI